MGGAEVFTREVAERWVAIGHKVTLFTSEFPGCKKKLLMVYGLLELEDVFLFTVKLKSIILNASVKRILML